jgi:GTP 3',8-cyclase
MELRDHKGRKINYLRLSVTDRCNLRCVYCMPEEGVEFTPYSKILRLEQLAGLASRFIILFGIDKVRLTGGEPLTRKNIEVLIELISAIPQLKDLALTTNGTRLAHEAHSIKAAGLQRINLSLDSLDRDRFRKITGGGNLDDVFAGIIAAKDAGFPPLKINTVLLPDFNEEYNFIEWANSEGHILRFIEQMPGVSDRPENKFIGGPSESELISKLQEKTGRVELIDDTEDEPGKHTRRYRVMDRGWEFGIIPAVSVPFCGDCNRIRLDCLGTLRSCLYSSDTIELRGLLDAPDEEFIEAVVNFVGRKTGRPLEHIGSHMSSIGG